MEDQNEADEKFSKKIYLHSLASELSSEIVEPLFNKNYPDVNTEDFFKSVNTEYCFIPRLREEEQSKEHFQV